jgi:hypothetical protein
MKARKPKRNPAQLPLPEVPPPPFEPTWPDADTLAARALDVFLRGYSMTHPQWEAISLSWRLSAVVYTLRDLGWPVHAEDINAPTPKNPDRIIARYSLPTDIRAQALLMRPRLQGA